AVSSSRGKSESGLSFTREQNRTLIIGASPPDSRASQHSKGMRSVCAIGEARQETFAAVSRGSGPRPARCEPSRCRFLHVEKREVAGVRLAATGAADFPGD